MQQSVHKTIGSLLFQSRIQLQILQSHFHRVCLISCHYSTFGDGLWLMSIKVQIYQLELFLAHPGFPSW
jgi:hypothetical protein